MGEEIASAGRLPFQSTIQFSWVDGQQDQIVLFGKVPTGRLRHLIPCREMDETIGLVDGRTIKKAR